MSELSPFAESFVPKLKKPVNGLEVPEASVVSDALSGPSYYCPDNSDRKGDLPVSHDEVEICLNSAENLLVFPASVHGETATALLDSGASCCLVKQSLVQRCGLQVVPCSRNMRGLGKASVGAFGSCDVDLRMGLITFKVKCMVLPDDAIRHPVILGCSFFTANSSSIDISDARLTGADYWGSWELYLIDNIIHTVFRAILVSAASSYTVGWGQPSLISIRLPGCVSLDSELELYFDGKLDSPYLAGQPGIVTFSDRVPAPSIMVQKVSGKWSREVLHCDRSVAKLTTLVELEPPPEVEVASPPEVEVALANEIYIDLLSGINLSHLSTDKQTEVKELLTQHMAAISMGDHDVGQAGVTRHKIELYDDTPIRQKPRRFPEPVAREIERQCEELRKLDIIDYSRSPWSAPIVPIRKADGSIRLCMH